MAKVALISCNTTRDPYPVYPLGMTMVAEAARAAGHEVCEWDAIASAAANGGLRNFLEANRPEYVGLSLRNVDSANYNKQDAYTDNYRQIVQDIRDITDAPVILGGSGYTIFPELMLEELGADYGITGEGESSFCRLIEQLEQGGDELPGIFSTAAPLSGSEFSAGNRNDPWAEFYLKNGGMLSVQTKRGCPHLCAYCSYPILEGRRYRFRQPEAVVDEIEMLIEKYGADYYSITDSVFNDAAGHYLEIAEELIRREISVPWMCFLRPDDFTREDVELLKTSGLDAVEWGTDCVTDETLKAMKKNFTWEQVVSSNRLFAEAGVANAHFLILGGPGENSKTLEAGFKNLEQLNNCVVFAGIGVRIFPHTEVYQMALEEGVIKPDQNLLPPTYYFSPEIDIDQMHERLLSVFQGRMDRIYPDGQFSETTRAFHELGNRGPAWDMLLRRNIRK